MGIVVDHAPAASVVLGAAGAAGYGNYLQRQDEIAAQRQQATIENNLRANQMALAQAENNRRFAYGAMQDQQQRADRAAELQGNRDQHLRDLQFQQGRDQQDFAQRKQLLDLKAKQEQEQIDFKLSAEDEAKQKQVQRQIQAIQNADYLDDQAKEYAIQQVQAQAKIGPPIPRDLEARQALKEMTIPPSQEGGPRMIRTPNGGFDIHPEDKYKMDQKKMEQQIVNQDRDDNRQLMHQAHSGWQKIQSDYAKSLTDRTIAKSDAVAAQRKLAIERHKMIEGVNKRASEMGQQVQDNPFPDIEAIEQKAAESFDKNNPPDPPPNRDEYYRSVLPPTAAPAQGVPQFDPQQSSLPVSSQAANPMVEAEPMQMPVTPQPQQQAPVQQGQQFSMPDNHPASPAYKEARANIPLGKDDAINEDALMRDFQIANVKEGPKGVERLKAELSQASQYVNDIDNGRANPPSTPQEMEKFRLAYKLLAPYVTRIPRNQR